MSPDTVISVENLGKKYIIDHERKNERYAALRDVLTHSAKSLMERLNPLNPNYNFKEKNGLKEEFWALKEVNFEIKQGDRVSIIGRNGAGKSTLLKLLSRITEPTTGKIKIRGRIASLLEVGTGFHPELTGRENIFLNGAILGMSKAEIKHKFDEITDFAEVERFLDTPVKRYSSGMYVRLAFAIAAHLQTDILIIDEILAVGDAAFQKKCLSKIRDTSYDGRTVILVSHQLGITKEVCSKGILFANGKLVEYNAIDQVIRNYLSDSFTNDSPLRYQYIESVQCSDREGGSNHIFFGDPLIVSIILNHLPDLILGVNLSIRNQDGKSLCLFSSNPHDGFSLPRKQNIQLKFVMNFCCFAPGEYFVNVALTEPCIRVIEEAQDVAKFDIIPKSVGGSWAYESRFGEVFPPHKWELD